MILKTTGRFAASLLLILSASAAHAAMNGFRPELDRLDQVPRHILPQIAKTVQVQSPSDALVSSPNDFAEVVDYRLGMNDGAWTLEDGVAIWRVRVESVNATAMMLKLKTSGLSSRARMYWFDTEGQLIQEIGDRAGLVASGTRWTPMVRGEAGILELQVPAAEQEQAEVDIDSVGVGYAIPGLQPRSGYCNVDVACSVAGEWSDEARAAVMLQVQVSATTISTCSGILINAASDDRRPRILTANHCHFTADNAADVVTYFNFQSSRCGGAADGNLSQNMTGVNVLFADTESDNKLLQLPAAPPSDYNVFLAGWYVGDQLASSGAAIHYPSGDEERISLFNQEVRTRRILWDGSATQVKTFEVFWTEGVTEPGSSGSGLLNQDHKVIGVLSAGTSSCAAPGGPDYFGRMDIGWQNGLSAYLDPNSTGIDTMDGVELDGPLALADALSVDASGAATIDVLANDSGSQLRLTAVGTPSAGGSVSIQNGVLVYSAPQVSGVDQFSYEVVDANGNTATSEVMVTIKSTAPTSADGGSSGTSVPDSSSEDNSTAGGSSTPQSGNTSSGNSSSGGGSAGIWLLALLAGVVGLRRRSARTRC